MTKVRSSLNLNPQKTLNAKPSVGRLPGFGVSLWQFCPEEISRFLAVQEGVGPWDWRKELQSVVGFRVQGLGV